MTTASVVAHPSLWNHWTLPGITSKVHATPSKYFNEHPISKLLMKDGRYRGRGVVNLCVLTPLHSHIHRKRLTASQCLAHPWVDSKTQRSSELLNIARLKSHMSSKKWQVCVVVYMFEFTTSRKGEWSRLPQPFCLL